MPEPSPMATIAVDLDKELAKPRNPGRETPDVWLIAKQEVVNVPGYIRPKLGYTILDSMPAFSSVEEAMAMLKGLKLPLGWVVVNLKQILKHIL